MNAQLTLYTIKILRRFDVLQMLYSVVVST